MEFILLALSLIFILVGVFTSFSKTGIGLAISALVGYFYLSPNGIAWPAVVGVTIGLILLLLEIFIPSFGLIGILGGASLYWGLIQTTGDAVQAAIDLILALIMSAIFFLALFKSGYISKNANKIILKSTSFTPKEEMPHDAKVKPTPHIGMTGITTTPLRPAGKVRLSSQTVIDVITAGEHLNQGVRVEIQQIIGSKIVVRKIS
ncbi:NfeD family protein [Allofustis seminis]|uniref:NfeD family protein n=1 Tax=Allofustis seminis TaxID=166939 RepID=UPI0003714336|nr:NfeD family protein [Allofustis seminis]